MALRKIVITGGSHAGKTTLINRLSQLGYATVGEAAIDIITQLNGLIGTDTQLYWRSRNAVAFQELIWERILLLESQKQGEDGWLFVDRGLYDGFAYLGSVTPETSRLFAERYAPYANYYKAFVLDTLPMFDMRKETGRKSSYELSCETGRSLAKVYSQQNVVTVVVPVMPIDARCNYILDNLGVKNGCK